MQPGHKRNRCPVAENLNVTAVLAEDGAVPAVATVPAPPEVQIVIDEDGNNLNDFMEEEEILDEIDAEIGLVDDLIDVDWPFWTDFQPEMMAANASIFPDGLSMEENKGKPINIPMATDRMNPVHFLELLFTNSILQRFVDNTNSFAGWVEGQRTNVRELKKYFGVVLYMGISTRPSRRMYWENSKYGDPWIKSQFTRQRFFDITRNLHWLDTSG